MDHPQTPRVLAPHLQTFQHRLVRVLGKVTQLRGETAVIDAGGNIDLILNRVCGFNTKILISIAILQRALRPNNLNLYHLHLSQRISRA